MFYHKRFCQVYNIAKGYSDFFFFFSTWSFRLPCCPLNALKIQIPHPKWKLAPKYLHMQARRAHPYPLEPFLPFQHYNVNLVNKQLHAQLEKGSRSVSLFMSTGTLQG